MQWIYLYVCPNYIVLCLITTTLLTVLELMELIPSVCNISTLRIFVQVQICLTVQSFDKQNYHYFASCRLITLFQS